MKPRKRMVQGLAALAAMLVPAVAAGVQEARPPQAITPSELKPGITLITSFPDGNMLIVRGTNGVLLVDAHAPAHAALAPPNATRASAGSCG